MTLTDKTKQIPGFGAGPTNHLSPSVDCEVNSGYAKTRTWKPTHGDTDLSLAFGSDLRPGDKGSNGLRLWTLLPAYR